jgi:hypothetical protein
MRYLIVTTLFFEATCTNCQPDQFAGLARARVHPKSILLT